MRKFYYAASKYDTYLDQLAVKFPTLKKAQWSSPGWALASYFTGRSQHWKAGLDGKGPVLYLQCRYAAV